MAAFEWGRNIEIRNSDISVDTVYFFNQNDVSTDTIDSMKVWAYKRSLKHMVRSLLAFPGCV